MKVIADSELQGILEGCIDVIDYSLEELEEVAITLEDMLEKLDMRINERKEREV